MQFTQQHTKAQKQNMHFNSTESAVSLVSILANGSESVILEGLVLPYFMQKTVHCKKCLMSESGNNSRAFGNYLIRGRSS